MRYLQRGVPQRGRDGADTARGQVVSFLRGIYESVAETLPDVRDEGCDEDEMDISELAKLSVPLPQLDPDPYTQVMADPAVDVKLKLQPRTRLQRGNIKLNAQRRPEHGFEKRWLPPGHMKDYYEQFQCTPDGKINGKPIAFSTFWRVWYQEFGAILQFRPSSSHAICSTCVRHKLLIKAFAGNLKARQSQIEYFGDHLKAQYWDRLCYWDLRAQARLKCSFDILVIVDGVDQSKFMYPRSDILFRSKELQGLIRPRAHVCGAIIHGRAVIFSVSPADVRKDANTSIELVAYCLQVVSRDVDLRKVTLHLQSDNTSREVKNNHTIRYLASLTAHGSMLFLYQVFDSMTHDVCFCSDDAFQIQRAASINLKPRSYCGRPATPTAFRAFA